MALNILIIASLVMIFPINRIYMVQSSTLVPESSSAPCSSLSTEHIYFLSPSQYFVSDSDISRSLLSETENFVSFTRSIILSSSMSQTTVRQVPSTSPAISSNQVYFSESVTDDDFLIKPSPTTLDVMTPILSSHKASAPQESSTEISPYPTPTPSILFSYGTDVGDNISQPDNQLSGPINLTTPLVYYLEEFTSLYISPRGFIIPISEGVPFRDSNPNVPQISPLWTIFTSHAIYYRVTDDVETLEAISDIIKSFNSDLSNYRPTLAIIVTWFNVPVQSTTNRNGITFQAVLSTDGRRSFAAFIYDDIFKIFDIHYVKYIRFDAGDRIRSTIILNHKSSIGDGVVANINVFRIDGNCVTAVFPGYVCGLNSLAIGCEPHNLTTLGCLCYPGFNTSDCQVSIPYICPTGSILSPCPEMPRFPVCFREVYLCNLISDCSNAADESSKFQCNHLFLPFGQAVGDEVAPHLDDFSLLVGNVDVPIVYFQEKESLIYASTNGLISLREEYNSWELAAFPHVPIIAPLWADFTLFFTGTLYYRVVSNSSTLDMVSKMIADYNQDLSDYRATLAVIITWFEVPLLRNQSIMETFQAVLSTNGNESFVAFLYDDSESVKSILSYPRLVGFNAGDRTGTITILKEESAEGTLDHINVFRIDGHCITTALPDAVCALDAATIECEIVNLTAVSCLCAPGYHYTDSLCEDLDECEVEPCNRNGNCINVPGSFRCVCNSGYVGDGFTCIDVDECLSHDCGQVCTNFIGGYNCSCLKGFFLEIDGRSCADIDECENSPCSNNADCSNTEGSFQCHCNSFYDGDGTTCSIAQSAIVGGSMGGVITLILLLLILIVVVFLTCRHLKKRKFNLIENISTECSSHEKEMRDMDRSHALKRLSTVQSSFNLNVPRSLLIFSCNLKIGKTIGQGEFGIVYKGHLKSSYNASYSELVAIKTLKGFLHKRLVRDLLKECAKMKEFDHPNVLRLLGVCLDGGPAPYIIMPFMSNGSLLSYLKQERESLVLDPGTLDDQPDVQKRLLDMCIQVAKGMEYLTSNRVIHRDLAARNCMIDSNFVIKVADFGLSESIDPSKDYFRQNKDDIISLPIKWLAPECLDDAIFSQKSDVWAYGVTCWEVFSGGKIPYSGIHPLNLSQKLEEGYRMDKPYNAACNEEMYFLMRKCWEVRPQFRPTFSNIVLILTTQLESLVEYMDILSRSNPANMTSL